MMSQPQNAYENFLRTGKIEDYLHYADTRRQNAAQQAVTGEQGAYYDGGNRSAGTADRGL